MASLGTTEIELKATGSKAKIPNDSRARLMYYLDCICTVLDMSDDPDINRLRNYGNYRKLGREETHLLQQMCVLLSPEYLEDKCIFQSNVMCHDSGNEFYEISSDQINLLVAGNVLIGGRQRQVTKIMTYKWSWLQKYYKKPMERLHKKGCAIL